MQACHTDEETRGIIPVTDRICDQITDVSRPRNVIISCMLSYVYVTYVSPVHEDNWSRYLLTVRERDAVREGNSATRREDALYSRMHDTPREWTPPESEGWVKVVCCRCPCIPTRRTLALLSCISPLSVLRDIASYNTHVCVGSQMYSRSLVGSVDVVVTCSHGDACLPRASARVGEEANPGDEDSRGTG